MRVLVAHHGYWPKIAGAEQMARHTARALAGRGHDVQLVGCRADPACALTSRGEVHIVDARSVDEVSRAAVAFGPQVVHLIDLVHTAFGNAARRAARGCQAAFAITPATVPSLWEKPAEGAELCGSADIVFCLSDAERAALEAAGVPQRQIHRLSQAPALAQTGDGEHFQARYRTHGPLILFLGRKAGFKGYRQLLDARWQVWRRFPRATFVFVGPPWDSDSDAVLSACRDSRIIDLGPVSEQEKEDALAACTVLCLPSREEVVPLTLIEAWSYGKPVISGAFPGADELVSDRKDGLIVDQRAPAIAAAIIKILADPAQARAMGEAGERKVLSGMSWETIAGELERAYESCIRATSRRGGNDALSEDRHLAVRKVAGND